MRRRGPHRGVPGAAADAAVIAGRRAADARAQGYREQALRMYPWVCGRCSRTFTAANVRELTVHHRDHNHDHNPPDGSNWELLCLYCHDDEHRRQLEQRSDAHRTHGVATGKPLSALKDLFQGRTHDDDP